MTIPACANGAAKFGNREKKKEWNATARTAATPMKHAIKNPGAALKRMAARDPIDE
ncbi:hypothetical protein [Herbaspirillum hiltneri]|uniref:hypothetical protein n=1 Tax=Herbaspirillum hiltneri TaxID=341045 RepID=UPI000A4DF261|nr:hypothetical protein [Herbaspirillum hiltneri]